jgi:hypothetical protein
MSKPTVQFILKPIGPFAVTGLDGKLLSTGLKADMITNVKERMAQVNRGDTDAITRELDADGREIRLYPAYIPGVVPTATEETEEPGTNEE